MFTKSIGKIWRGFGNGFFIALIAVGGTFLSLTVFPVIVLTTRKPEDRQRKFQTVLHYSFKLYCAAIHYLGIAKIQTIGLERLRNLNGVMIVANHPSLLDVVMIMSIVPRVQCIVKAALWDNPLFRLTVSGAGYIRNDLDPETLIDTCRTSLAAGNNLIVFPEGTRSRPGQPPRLQRGFANIATFAQVDIQIITLTCEPPILFKGNPWWKVPEERSCFTMEVGECLNIQSFTQNHPRPLAARKLVTFLEGFYKEKLGYG